MDPSRETLWNIEYSWIFYVLAVLSILVFIYAIYGHYRRWRIGQPANRFNKPGKRLIDFLSYAVIDGLFHRRFFGVDKREWRFNEFYPGLIHILIFSGVIILFLATVLEFFSHYIFHFLHGNIYLAYSVLADVFGILAIIGVILAIIRRYIQKPSRLDNKRDDLTALLLILVIILTGFVVEGFRIAATELQINPEWASWSPGGYILARAFSGMSIGALLDWHIGMWWFHIILSLGTLVYVSLFNSRLFHIIWDPVNVFFRNLGPRGALSPLDFENTELFGVAKIEDFTWKQLLDLDACTRCGRCQDACPAYFSGKNLNPKKVIQDLKNHLYDVYPRMVSPKPVENRLDMVSEVITDKVIWDCTTCRACQEVCPVYIEHVDKIIDMRRNLTMERSQFPEEVRNTLKSLNDRGHPFRGTTATRTTWFEGLYVQELVEEGNPEMLYWVGCTTALEDRNMNVAKAMVKILQAAGVNFHVLGSEEKCCGDPARRMGDEYLFQTICQNNIEIFKTYGIKKIVTTCPHCFNTLKYEYPQFGGYYDVFHHTRFIADLIRYGRLKFDKLMDSRITYHDSCYLGRYNDIYTEPRAILTAINQTGITELNRSRARSFCCGGGGGHMWMEEEPDKRVNARRIEEVIQANVNAVATACPYCLTMFEDGIKTKGMEETLQAKDLSELVAEALKYNE